MIQLDSTTVNIVIGVINFLALVFVGIQTYITRKSWSLSQSSFIEAQKDRQITQLHDSGWVIHVLVYLKGWRKDLQRIVDDEQTIMARIAAGDKKVGNDYGLHYPKGILRKSEYDMMPEWLQYVLMSGAQYYFDAMSFAYVLSTCEIEMGLKMLPDTIDHCKSGIIRIDEMNSYISNVVPEWYLNSPASVNDSNFF